MAMVDFTNARIEPVGTQNLLAQPNVDMNSSVLKDSNNTTISTANITSLINQQKQLMYSYQGTFNASGTEFYVGYTTSGGSLIYAWKVSNISFNSGDTYVFQINANLVCN